MFLNEYLNPQSQVGVSSHLNSDYSKGSYSDIDLQYQLYSRYMELSKQQIAIQQLMIIKDSQNLIQSIAINKKIDLFKDVTSTMESFSYDEDLENSIMQDFSTIERRSAKKITRKSTRNSILKPVGRYNQQFENILDQIQRNCSEKTLSIVKSLMSQHKKNLSKMIDIQKKQKNIRKIQQGSQKLQQQNLLLKSKIIEIQQNLKIKEEQIKIVKQKLNQIKNIQKQNIFYPSLSTLSVTTKQNSQQNNSIKVKCQGSVLAYVNQKQTLINQRMKKIQKIQDKIQRLIEQSVILTEQESNYQDRQNCPKCCNMIRKIKDSVMNYRHYLEQQAQECQKLYNFLKAQIQSNLTQRKIHTNQICYH